MSQLSPPPVPIWDALPGFLVDGVRSALAARASVCDAARRRPDDGGVSASCASDCEDLPRRPVDGVRDSLAFLLRGLGVEAAPSIGGRECLDLVWDDWLDDGVCANCAMRGRDGVRNVAAESFVSSSLTDMDSASDGKSCSGGVSRAARNASGVS